ncbi:MAG: PH domain-containing protein [Patescibacteria group bacterium]
MFEQRIREHLKDGEEQVAFIRQYIVTLWPAILLSVFFILAPFFFMVPLFRRGTGGVAIFLTLIAIGVLAGVRQWILWNLNAFLITNQRIIDFDQSGLFHRRVSEASYEKIQDVSFSQDGVLATLLDYGNVHVQTAGTQAQLEILCVHRPKDLQALITETQRKNVVAS